MEVDKGHFSYGSNSLSGSFSSSVSPSHNTGLQLIPLYIYPADISREMSWLRKS